MTNYEWLLQMGGEDRQAWFDAEHVEPRKVNMKRYFKPFIEAEQRAIDVENDSREKLEDDVVHECARPGFGPEFGEIMVWLDRQAAITERETKLRELYKFEENHRYHIRSIEEVNQKLNKRIAELTAERDEWHERFRKANKDKCDLQSRGEQQRLNNLLHRLADKGAKAIWDDSRSDYTLVMPDVDALNDEINDLKEEYGWLYEFHTRMGAKCGSRDCRSLVAYVEGLESKVASLTEDRDHFIELFREQESRAERHAKERDNLAADLEDAMRKVIS